MATVDLLNHARAAIERAAADLEALKSDEANAASMSRQHCALLDENVRNLTHRLSVLTDRFDEMTRADAGHLPALWRNFFVAYDDYLETVRHARVALAREDYLDDLGVVAPIVDDGTSRPGA